MFKELVTAETLKPRFYGTRALAVAGRVNL